MLILLPPHFLIPDNSFGYLRVPRNLADKLMGPKQTNTRVVHRRRGGGEAEGRQESVASFSPPKFNFPDYINSPSLHFAYRGTLFLFFFHGHYQRIFTQGNESEEEEPRRRNQWMVVNGFYCGRNYLPPSDEEIWLASAFLGYDARRICGNSLNTIKLFSFD